jgi:bifunctional UDP-N-acetylglucosamine pyrophosphorylase/glucosamine-1-phosphate N-acetyltransferase
VTDARPTAVVVLAAGEGTRMRSATPKVLHQLAGRSLVGHALAACGPLGADVTLVVVGAGRDAVIDHLARTAPHATPVVQAEQHQHTGAVATVLTAVLPDPTGYGRVLRRPDGGVAGIVEHRDATDEQRAVAEINTSVYAFEAGPLRDVLSTLSAANAQGEEYLTDVIGAFVDKGLTVGALEAAAAETAGVNDRVQLAAAARAYNDRVLTGWMRSGVTVLDPASTWVDADVELAPDVTLRPGVQLHGRTVVESGAEIGPDCTLTGTVVRAGARVVRAHCDGAEVGPGASVGPFAYLRPGARLGPGAKVGTYVEVKGSELGAGAKVPHLSYVGDATIGAGANLGAGTITANYDGVDKHRTTIGEHVRTGSDTVLVAPVTIGDGAYTAAGSVIVDEVPAGELGVGRARQRNIPGWVARRRAGTSSAAAAARARGE